MSRGAKVLYCVYLALLMGFTGFVALDTFVIARVETTLEAPRTTQTPSVASAEPTITENSYQDAHISIQIDTRRLDDTTVYIADVTLSSPEYLKTALAQNAYGKNVTETTSAIAARQSAILAINGDYYGSRERGYVLRNGTLYRSTAAADQEALVIFSDGSFAVIDEGSISADSLLQQGAMQVLSFGPALVADGEITVSQKDEVGKAMVSNPRTAIGVVAPLHYLLVVSDDRHDRQPDAGRAGNLRHHQPPDSRLSHAVRRAVPGRGAGISDCSAENDMSGGKPHAYVKVSQDP